MSDSRKKNPNENTGSSEQNKEKNLSKNPPAFSALRILIAKQTETASPDSQRKEKTTARGAANEPPPSAEKQTMMRVAAIVATNDLEDSKRQIREAEEKAKALKTPINSPKSGTSKDELLSPRSARPENPSQASAREYAKKNQDKLFKPTSLIKPKIEHPEEVLKRVEARKKAMQKEKESTALPPKGKNSTPRSGPKV
jgi:hypothetical protein